MDVDEIVKNIMMMKNTENLNHLKKVINMRRQDLARDLKYVLKPGDRVKVDGNRVTGGIIEKINRTKVVVRDEDGQGWTVPLTMIRTGE